MKDTATRFSGFIDVSPTLLARDHKGFNNYGMAAVLEITKEGDDMDDKGTVISCTEMVLDPPEIQVMGELDQTGHDHGKRVHDPEGISPTVTAVAGGTHHVKIFDYSRFRVRRLTPTEYGRLQGFPMDTWRQVVSDTQAYKQFGNAVTTTVAKAIAESLATFLSIRGLGVYEIHGK